MKRITLEICTNTEWLREHGGLCLDRIPDGLENDAADSLRLAAARRLNHAGYDIVNAKGQRTLYHGWNGANTFEHKLSIVGTFDELTKEQENEIFDLIQAAREEVYAEYAAEDEASL